MSARPFPAIWHHATGIARGGRHRNRPSVRRGPRSGVYLGSPEPSGLARADHPYLADLAGLTANIIAPYDPT